MRLQVIIQLLMCITIFGICFGQEIACDDRETRIYKCNNGKCISRNHFCNGTSECSDGSDEYTNTTLMDGMMCQTRRFTPVEKHCVLPTAYLCDHEIDCVGGHDECGCNHTFQCDNGDCVLKVSFCDNMEPEFGCLDGTDERLFNRTTREGFQCPVTRTHLRKTCVLPDQYICDGDSDCDFGIDECFCNFTEGKKKGIPLNDVYSNENCFRCLDGSLVIPNIHVCDGIIHCEDLSDECICPETIEKPRPAICDSVCEGPKCGCPGQVECIPKVFSTSNGTSQIQEEKVCIDHTSICDDVFECENHVDETFCPIDNNTFLCYDGNKKIKQHQLCNGPEDCDDGSDELYCHQINDYFCKSYRRFFRDVQDWDNATVTEQEVFIPPNVVLAFDRPFFTHACDGIPLCQGLDDECNNGCPVEHEYCKHVTRGFRCPNSGSLIIGVEICDGKPTCNDIAPEVSVDEFGCPGRFYCHNRGKTRLPIHIPIDGKCNGKQECDDISDELNCSSTTHFYCNDEGSTLFVPIDQVCDGRIDCKEGGDECQNCNPSPFSDDKKLISSRVLIVFLWIIGTLSVVGNTSVIIYQIICLVRPSGNQSPVATSNRMLVLNLSASDLLVGIYLVGLGVKDATVSEYCLLDQEWRCSVTCTALGSLALIGTETSVFILLIMTAYRLYLVVRPFKAQKLLIIGISIALAWTISLALAFAPLASSAQDYFVSCVWFRNHQFMGKVCRKDLQKYTQDLVLYEGNSTVFSNIVETGYTWENMFTAMKQLNSSYVPERYFGYYSAHSVCLPRLFPDPQTDKVWGYSLFLILINFFAFVFILVSYIYIYKTTTSGNIKKSKSEDRAQALQRKVTRIVLTDFCCWMPICIMAFIRVSGIQVPDEAYAVTAIILLPINSAMNPFLYSDILDIVWERLLPVRNWFNSTKCGQKLKKIQNKRQKQKNKSTLGANSSCDTKSTALGSGQLPQHTHYSNVSPELKSGNGREKQDRVYYEVQNDDTQNGNSAQIENDTQL